MWPRFEDANTAISGLVCFPALQLRLYRVYLTIIPRGHVGYEMIDSQQGA